MDESWQRALAIANEQPEDLIPTDLLGQMDRQLDEHRSNVRELRARFESVNQRAGNDAADEDEPLAPTRSSPPQRNKPGRKAKSVRNPLSHVKYPVLPIRVRNVDDTSWVDMDGLDKDLQDMITENNEDMAKVKRHNVEYTRLHNRFVEQDAYNEEACIQCITIRKNRKLCDLSANNQACATCVDSKDSKKMPTLCARIFKENGQLVAGYVPLPRHLRDGKSWTEMAYWLAES